MRRKTLYRNEPRAENGKTRQDVGAHGACLSRRTAITTRTSAEGKNRPVISSVFNNANCEVLLFLFASTALITRYRLTRCVGMTRYVQSANYMRANDRLGCMCGRVRQTHRRKLLEPEPLSASLKTTERFAKLHASSRENTSSILNAAVTSDCATCPRLHRQYRVRSETRDYLLNCCSLLNHRLSRQLTCLCVIYAKDSALPSLSPSLSLSLSLPPCDFSENMSELDQIVFHDRVSQRGVVHFSHEVAQ